MTPHYRIQGGPLTQGSKVIDLATGEALKGVKSVKLSAVPNDLWQASVELIGVEVDIQAEPVKAEPLPFIEINLDAKPLLEQLDDYIRRVYESMAVPAHMMQPHPIAHGVCRNVEPTFNEHPAYEIGLAFEPGIAARYSQCAYEWPDLAANAG